MTETAAPANTDELEPRRIQRFGWKPSLPDQRDILADTSALPVAAEVDPRGEYMTPIYDQGNLGSCTANTVAEAVDADRIVSGEEPLYPSRLAIYALERLYEGSSLTEDTGAYGRDGYKACRRFGMVPESELPYSDEAPAWQQDPRELIRAAADRTKLEHPYKVVPRNWLAMQRVLTNKQTIGFGFTVYESFESSEVRRTGIVPMPGPDEKSVGGHEVLAVGYLKAMPGYALVRNHWASDWGEEGYFFMPVAYLLDPRLSDDFRTIYRPARV
jgi:C1A family cysteine protease